jgi:hypothetical protein
MIRIYSTTHRDPLVELEQLDDVPIEISECGRLSAALCNVCYLCLIG